jgi:hypothetical protein
MRDENTIPIKITFIKLFRAKSDLLFNLAQIPNLSNQIGVVRYLGQRFELNRCHNLQQHQS